MSSLFNKIMHFHEFFGIEPLKKPGLLPIDIMDFRLVCLNEELQEISDAYLNQDLHEVADGLVDLVYFAMGTAYLMGLPFNELFNEVHRANMAKVRCNTAGESKRAFAADVKKRAFAADVKKPEGWRQPDFTEWLGEKL